MKTPPGTRLLLAQMEIRSAANELVRASAATARTDDPMPLTKAGSALYAALIELHHAVTAVQDDRHAHDSRSNA